MRMKKLIFFAIVAFGMLACSEKNTPKDDYTPSQKISCDPNFIEFEDLYYNEVEVI